MKEYGLVLAGGGAKGGYEIGVWKALRELEIPISAVAGTSVGALNGAIIVQGDYEKAYDMWTSLTTEDVIKVGSEVAAVQDRKNKPMGMLTTFKAAFSTGGLDVTPLKELIENLVDEEKIRKSPIDFGMVTFSLSDFKPEVLFKEDIPEGKLVDYLLASSCFPAFKPHEIDNKRYIDGGVYDNMPISLMIRKKIKDIITVDISGPGVNRKVDKRGLNIIEIKATDDLGGTLDFNGERSKANMELGYYDTLKAFGKLKGSRYFLMPTEDFEKSKETYIKSLGIEDFKKMYKFLGMDWTGKSVLNNKFILDRIMRTIQQYSDNKLTGDTVFPAMAEIAAEQLGIERRRIYTLNELVDGIIKEYENTKNSRDYKEYMQGLTRLLLSRSQFEFDREVKKNLIEGKFIMSYEPYLDHDDEKIKRFRRFIAMAFPKISVANMFLSLVLPKEKESVHS